jgi:hypothetical protein
MGGSGRLVRSVDIATAVSEIDAGAMARLYGVQPRLLPNGVDAAAFERISPAEIEAVRARYGLNGREALFMGLLGYPPTTRRCGSFSAFLKTSSGPTRASGWPSSAERSADPPPPGWSTPG